MPIYKKALEHYGVSDQIEMFIEECTELISDIQRHKRGRLLGEDLAEETADVVVVMRQLVNVRPLAWSHIKRPETLDQVRGYLFKAAEGVAEGGVDALGQSIAYAFQAALYLIKFAGEENVESWIKTKTARLERRMLEEALQSAS